tara:strand:+ start:2237 stop:3676 length:1440 start_codon:yes stop_codon:yes gene_type:complete
MALPSSGPISLSDIAGEVGDSTTSNISLGKLSVYDLGDIPSTGYPLGSGFHGWADSDRTSQLQAAGRVGNTTGTNLSNRIVVLPSTEPTDRLREITLSNAWSVNFWIKPNWSVQGTNQMINQGRYIFLLGTAGNAVHENYNSNVYNNNFRIFYDSQQNRITIGFLADNSSGSPVFRQSQWFFHSTDTDMQAATGLGTSGTSTTWWSATNRGNANSNGFNMITFRFTGDAWSSTNPKLYWNGVYCGPTIAVQGNGTPAPDDTTQRGISFMGTPYGNSATSGGTFTNGAGYFGGNTGTTIVDRVSFFRTSLSLANMSGLYNSGQPNGIPTGDSDLIAYYSFNTNTENQTITDSRPVFPVKQGTDGYGGVDFDGSSDFTTGQNQAEPGGLTAFSYNSTGVNGRSGPSTVCDFETVTDTAYHDGTGTVPVSGDMVYSDSAGTTPLAIVNSDATSYTFLDGSTRKYLKISSTTAGLVTDTSDCE